MLTVVNPSTMPQVIFWFQLQTVVREPVKQKYVLNLE